MRNLVWIALFGCLAAPVLEAQQRRDFWIYGQVVEQRGASRIGYWKRNVNAGLGEVVVDYGRPVWKEHYEQQLDQLTRGKMWRMGDNYWTLLDTNLPLEVAGVKIPVGLYYLAVRRSQDGASWELVFIDPVKSRERLLDSYDVGTRPGEVPVLFSAPLSFHHTQELVERLTILLTLKDKSQTEGKLELTWGKFSLSAPLEITVPPPAEP